MSSFALVYLFDSALDKGFVVYCTPPTVNIISLDDDVEAFEGYSVEFRALFFDAKDQVEQLTVEWTSDKKGDLGTVYKPKLI